MSKRININRLLEQRRFASPPPPRREIPPKIEKRTYAVEKRALRRSPVE